MAATNPSVVMPASKCAWKRPSTDMHAHWDCFSGAAGDMMLAACLDAAGGGGETKAQLLLEHVTECLEEGLSEIKGEFSIAMKRVWRSQTGSIAAMYVSVGSKYHHAPAPVPAPAEPMPPQQSPISENSHNHTHGHGHGHGHGHERQEDKLNKESNQTSNPDSVDPSHENSSHHTTNNEPHEHAHAHAHHSHVHSHENIPHSTSKAANNNNNNNNNRDPLRNFPQIKKMLLDAPSAFIPTWVKDNAVAAFEALAVAEATTHGAASPDEVHFHEVGAVDSIVDTVGTLLALYALGVTSVSCSRLPLGEGTVWTDHGLLPVPAPATLRLLVNMPTCPGPSTAGAKPTGELVTPTAAALLKVLTRGTTASTNKPTCTGRPPCFTLRQVGIGAGTKDFEKHPNILRLMLGDNVMDE